MVRIEGVTKIYNEGSASEVRALDDVNLTIQDGELLAITGESGSGKSTLLNLIGALDTPTKGRIFVGSEEISRLSGEKAAAFRRKHLGFVLQGFYLEEDFSVLVNVEIPLMLQGVDKEERRKRAMSALEEMGLKEKADFLVTQLSGGQKQRVCIARALAGGAELILADEPTGNLDSENGEAVMRTFRELTKKGVTVVVVTHNMQHAGVCDRTVNLKDGRVTE